MTTHPDSTPATIDAALAALAESKTEWAQLPISLKLAYLDGLRERVDRVAERWVEAAATAKGLPEGSPLRGEEWQIGPWALAYILTPLARTLQAVQDGTLADLVEGRVRQRADGQTVVRVMPTRASDRVLASGLSVDVWMEPGVTPEGLTDTMAAFYRQEDPPGAVSLVLGAGNVSSIAPLDVLHMLYAEGSVVALKLNPVNAYLGPILREVFEEFIESGYLRLLYGGADVGERLTRHDLVEAIHVTGSAATHDAIVYGTGPDAAVRKERDEPQIHTPVSSELGGVSPCIVVPGDWSAPDLAFQAAHVATQKMNNGGFNCVATQALVLPEGWRQRDPFVHAVRKALRDLPDRPAYYPGADDRVEAIQAAYPGTAERLGASGARTFITNVPAESGEPALTEEVFGAVLAATSLPGGGEAEDPGDWLDRAVDFCNTSVAGTLAANILIHPRTLRQLGDRFWNAVARLRYGTVGVNLWSGAGFLLSEGAWGAFPGHTRDDIQSGSGKVHNAYLFGQVQKTVVQGPFADFPRSLLLGETHTMPLPPWFVTNPAAETVSRQLARYATRPGALRAAGVVAATLRG